MTRYRKIEVGLWYDRRVRELSRPKPNARDLWIYLLCGQRTTTFPGLVAATEAIAADDLGWPVSADLFAPNDDDGPRCFRDCWREIGARGMAIADWGAGVIVLPHALVLRTGVTRESARPSSVNTFKSWAKSWTEIPDCDLKDTYLVQLGRFARALDAELHSNPQVDPQGNPQGDEGGDGGRKRRRRGSKTSDTPYTDAYLYAFATDLGRVGDQSVTSRVPARVPVPVPVPDLPDRERVFGSVGFERPDPDREPAVSLPGDRVRGGVRRDEVAHASLSARAPVPPTDQRTEARTRILRTLVPLHVQIFNRARSALAAQVPAMAVVGDPAERALRELLDQQVSLEGFEEIGRHVLAVREAEAMRPGGSVKYLGASVWSPASFAAAKTMEVGELRGADKPRGPAALALAQVERLREKAGDA